MPIVHGCIWRPIGPGDDHRLLTERCCPGGSRANACYTPTHRLAHSRRVPLLRSPRAVVPHQYNSVVERFGSPRRDKEDPRQIQCRGGWREREGREEERDGWGWGGFLRRVWWHAYGTHYIQRHIFDSSLQKLVRMEHFNGKDSACGSSYTRKNHLLVKRKNQFHFIIRKNTTGFSFKWIRTFLSGTVLLRWKHKWVN